jgi:hypothetical protein
MMLLWLMVPTRLLLAHRVHLLDRFLSLECLAAVDLLGPSQLL